MSVDFEVIKRYLNGKEKTGDKEKVMDWFSDLTAEKDLLEKYRRYWDHELTGAQNTEGYDGSLILDRIYHKIKLEESASTKKFSIFSRTLNIISRIAAVLFIPLVTYLLLNTGQLISTGNETAWSEIYSPLGTRTMFYLPDGSTGWLNSDSRLEFPVEFRGKTRNVILNGEGYFDVSTNPKKPFVVSGSDIEVVAHGTRFNILAYPGEEEIKVTHVEGEIDVFYKREEDKVLLGKLEPDQTCIYNVNTSSHRIENVVAAKIISWKEGKLVFRNETFDEVVKRINRWYNVNLVLMDDILKSYTYMATFEDETLDEVLKLLKLSAPIYYKDMGRKIKEDGTYRKREIEVYYKR